MGILLQPTWWQDSDGASPPIEWEAAPQDATVTAAHPAATRFVVTTPLPNGVPVILGGTAVPTGFTAGDTYYVIALPSIDAYTFALSSQPGGAPIAATDAGTAVTVTDKRYYMGTNGDVILLLHFDGTNGSQVFTDSSTYHETNIGQAYDCKLSTLNPEFGTAALGGLAETGCARVIYDNAIIPLPTRYDIAVGKDFTIEAAFRKDAIDASDNGCIFGFSTAPIVFLEVFTVGVSGFLGAQARTQDGMTLIADLVGDVNVCDGAYHQVSFERKGTTYYLYCDGELIDSTTNAGVVGTTYNELGIGLALAAEGNQDPFFNSLPSYIDEVRFTQNVALRDGASSYTPASAAFPDPGATAMLQYVGNVNTPSLQSGMFGMLRIRYDVVRVSTDSLNFVYNTGAGLVTQALTNTLGAHDVISICLDGATQLDWGIDTGAAGAIVAFSEAPGDSTYGNVNFNCMCPELPIFETLTALRNRMMLRLGFGAQVANPPPGMTLLLNEFLISAQTFLWKKYPATFTRRLFTWNMQPLERFYGVAGNNDDPYRNLRMDFTKGIEWSGIYDQKNTWTPITEGIPPELYTMVTQAGRPQRYELRECIEVFPTPDVPYTLVLKGHITLQPFASDNDTTTIDSEVVFLMALATAKGHYGQVDAPATGKMAMDYLGELTAGTHLNKRYIPGPRPLSPVVKPQMVQFQDGN